MLTPDDGYRAIACKLKVSGFDNRVKLPCCVMKNIAERYPDTKPKVGFKRSRFDFEPRGRGPHTRWYCTTSVQLNISNRVYSKTGGKPTSLEIGIGFHVEKRV